MKITVDTGVFDTPPATDYFSKADHRILCGCRATLEMLDIPLPDWAQRKPTGPKPGRAIIAAYRADNPETLHDATMRKAAELTARLPAKTDSPGTPQSLRDRIAALKAGQALHSTTRADDIDPLAFLSLD